VGIPDCEDNMRWMCRHKLLEHSASIGITYMLATKKLLSDDPVLWFSMMLMPCGPPAIILSSLAELQGNSNTTLQVAKLLMV